MKRRPLIVGNWKMNKTTAEATELAQELLYEYERSFKDIDVVLCPPFTDLRSVRVVLSFEKEKMQLGAQDVYWEDIGAFTGAISPLMLKELRCSYCIIGHSERREFFGETDETVNRKARALIKNDIRPIICCGETLETRESGKTEEYVTAQVRAALVDIDAATATDIVIAYEPIWAIGTGLTPTPEQVDDVSCAIRKTLADLYDTGFAEATRILYGGSMKPSNVEHFVPLSNIDGGLIGGAALVASDFADLVRAFAKGTV